MSDFFFISYSSVDGEDFAMKLAKKLAAGRPTIPMCWINATFAPVKTGTNKSGKRSRHARVWFS